MTALKPGRVAPLSAALALLAGCGIPSYPSLEEPGIVLRYPAVESGLEFVFDVPTENDATIFEGFELYYRLYSGVEVDEGLIDQHRQSIIDKPTLEARGYDRFYLPGTTSPATVTRPLVPLSPTQRNDATLEIIIDLTPLIESETSLRSPYPVVQVGDDQDDWVELARDISSDPTTLSLKGFFPDAFAASDGDTPPTFDPASTDRAGALYLSVYVMSYGNDFPSLQFNIYSQPAWAGYVAIPGQ